MKKTVIIVAGGSGTRMGSEVPKQFIPINETPVLMHTIKRFHEYDNRIDIIIALPENQFKAWENLTSKYSFSIPHMVVKGGITRYHSVKNALDKIQDICIVAVHDGVRPLCTVELIKRCFEEAEKTSNAIPSIRITESIREVNEENNSTIDRDKLRIIQTPQCFDSLKLKRAYEKSTAENFTDDAGVFENDGNKINLIEGEKTNIKITTPEDLIIASAIERLLFTF